MKTPWIWVALSFLAFIAAIIYSAVTNNIVLVMYAVFLVPVTACVVLFTSARGRRRASAQNVQAAKVVGMNALGKFQQMASHDMQTNEGLSSRWHS
jgi:hypothetical protein